MSEETVRLNVLCLVPPISQMPAYNSATVPTAYTATATSVATLMLGFVGSGRVTSRSSNTRALCYDASAVHRPHDMWVSRHLECDHFAARRIAQPVNCQRSRYAPTRADSLASQLSTPDSSMSVRNPTGTGISPRIRVPAACRCFG